MDGKGTGYSSLITLPESVNSESDSEVNGTVHVNETESLLHSDGEPAINYQYSSVAAVSPSSPSSSHPPTAYSKWKIRVFLGLLASFSATGGFLFGYDTGVVSGAMLKVDSHFHLDSFWHELIVSVTIGAAAISAALAGPLTEWFGRKPALLLASLIFTVGAIVMGVASDKYVLLIGRVIIGLGIGLAAMAVPMYIAESAPAHLRGKLVVMNNLFITGGQFVATIIDGAFSSLSDRIGWRLMLGLAGIPSVIMFVGFVFMPESPRWLVFKGKSKRAREVLYKLRDPSEVSKELESIERDFLEYKKLEISGLDLLKKFVTSRTVIFALIAGCGLQMFQQLGGINTVMYYSASIIQMSGFSANASIWLAALPAAGNFIFTIAGLVLVDRLGRRKLLIGSLVGVILSFLLLSGSFVLNDVKSLPAKPLTSESCDYTNCGSCVGNSKCGFCAIHSNITGSYINGTCSKGSSHHSHHYLYNDTNTCQVYSDINDNMTLFDGVNEFASLVDDSTSDRFYTFTSCPDSKFSWLSLVALFLYIMFFAPGMGPLPWTVNSEIYPTWARSTAIAIATATNWIFNLFVSLTFLTFADVLGQPITFGFYAGLGLLGLIFVIFFVPETRGRKLEEMEELFQRPYFLQWFKNVS